MGPLTLSAPYPFWLKVHIRWMCPGRHLVPGSSLSMRRYLGEITGMGGGTVQGRGDLRGHPPLLCAPFPKSFRLSALHLPAGPQAPRNLAACRWAPMHARCLSYARAGVRARARATMRPGKRHSDTSPCIYRVVSCPLAVSRNALCGSSVAMAAA